MPDLDIVVIKKVKNIDMYRSFLYLCKVFQVKSC